MSVIEAMAMALYDSESNGEGDWGKLDVFTRGALKRDAQAALTALAENITPAMVAAGWDAYARKADDVWSMTPTEHPDDGGGAMGYALRAMCAAAATEEVGRG